MPDETVADPGPYRRSMLADALERLGNVEHDISEERRRVDTVIGPRGDNGKLGALRAEVRLHRGIFAAVGTALAGAAATVYLVLNSAAETRGRERAEAEHLRQQVERNSARIEEMQDDLFKLRLRLPPARPAREDSP